MAKLNIGKIYLFHISHINNSVIIKVMANVTKNRCNSTRKKATRKEIIDLQQRMTSSLVRGEGETKKSEDKHRTQDL